MSFEFCFFKQLDKPLMLLKHQIILPLFKDFFSSAISTVFNTYVNNIYQYKFIFQNC